MTDSYQPEVPGVRKISDTVWHSSEQALNVLTELREELVQLAQAAADASETELSGIAGTFVDLISVAASLGDEPGTGDLFRDITDYCAEQALPLLRDAASGSSLQYDQVRLAAQDVLTRWGEYLELLGPEDRFQPVQSEFSDIDRLKSEFNTGSAISDSSTDGTGSGSEELQESSHDLAADIQRILDSLQSLQGPEDAQEEPKTKIAVPPTVDRTKRSESAPSVAARLLQPERIEDPELVAAFTDDATQCLAEMEASLLTLESGQNQTEALRSFCRQLHTLKGASGTVGLSQLAAFLHDLENQAESVSAAGSIPDVEILLKGVDAVRDQLEHLSSPPGSSISSFGAGEIASKPPTLPPRHSVATSGTSSTSTSTSTGAGTVVSSGSSAGNMPSVGTTASSPASPAPARSENPGTPLSSFPADSEQYVRVEASRLERLMDLLAELVMLRNRRDTYVRSLRNVHEELNGCAARARSLTSIVDWRTAVLPLGGKLPQPEDLSSPAVRTEAESSARLLTRSMLEVSNDLSELSRALNEVCDPLAADNSAVSHLIGRFRQDLMELQRLPLAGLFQRLHRAVREAAKAEGKQVELVLAGQAARAERSLQDRLFEPLMHLVRNAVSHGIENRNDRIAAGKRPVGKVTLDAWSSASYLHIEVRDDGRGLNDEVLEARGRELGLLPPGQPVSRDRLRKLIFQPGFSTRSQVTEVAGRGVGMDVVDSWVRRLRGRIDVESAIGQGTTFRLQIPLRSAIEHSMLVRVGTQLFAIPMQAISGTVDTHEERDVIDSEIRDRDLDLRAAVPLGQLLGLNEVSPNRQCHLTIRDSGDRRIKSEVPRKDSEITIAVDAVVGVEEVVVRPLPSLLQGHELFAGVTLSGRAETVLLLDIRGLIEFSRKTDLVATHNGHSLPAGREQERRRQRVLIADDSVTVRRILTRRLTALGYSTVEASQGLDAMRLIRGGGIDAVVTDIDMPKMNGTELLREIKSGWQSRTIPVVVVTSRDDPQAIAQLKKYGAAEVFCKPVTEGIISAIAEVLQSIRPAAAK